MSDVSTKTFIAKFATRENADVAVEHLVQKLNVDRADILVQTSGSQNSSGVDVRGGAAPTIDEHGRGDAPLGSEIEVSAGLASSDEDVVRAAFGDLGATGLSSR